MVFVQVHSCIPEMVLTVIPTWVLYPKKLLSTNLRDRV